MARASTLPDELPAAARQHNHLFALEGHLALLQRVRELGSRPLQSFLAHVTSTVPYYESAGRRGISLKDLPVVSRAEMLGQRAGFLSTRFLESAERLVARTNGTLGPSLAVSFDVAGFYDFNYASLFAIVKSRRSTADSQLKGEVGIVLVSDDPDQLRYTVELPMLGNSLARRLPLGRGAEEDRALLRYLRARKVPILHGKPHTLRELARLDRTTRGPQLRPRGIICAGESLYASDRARIASWFGCDPIDVYTSSEGGLVALGCPFGPGLHIATDRLLLEVARDDGTIAPHGRGSLLLTNLMNWGHAFVRYRLGDEATLATRCYCGHVGPTLVDLPGRDATAFELPRVGRVTSHELSAVLDRPEVVQFLVRQEPSGALKIDWIVEDGIGVASLTRELKERLQLLAGPQLTLNRVRRITGFGEKQRRFIGPQRDAAAGGASTAIASQSSKRAMV